MALNELMDGVLATLPECLAVCYIDMPETLVLTRRSSRPFPQEVLDSLAALAARLLNGDGLVPAWQQATGHPAPEQPSEAMVQNGEHLCLFLRVQKYPDHALCLLARQGPDPMQARAAAIALCKEIEDAL